MQMPTEIEAITSEFAKQQMLDCYQRGGAENVLEFTLQRLEDPIQPLTDKGNRRYHPLLWTAVLVSVSAAGIFVYFTLKP